MQAFYQNNKKAVLTVAGVGAVAALLATLYSSQSKKGHSLSQKPNAANKTPTVADERKYQQLQEKPILNTAMNVNELILSSIPVEYDNEVLTLATINRINSTAADLSVSELLEAVKEFRKQRRGQDNLQKYIDLYYENGQKIKEIGEKHRREVLKQLNVTEEALQKALAQHAVSESALVNDLHERLATNLAATKELSVAQLESILQDELSSLKEAGNGLNEIRNLAKKGEDAARIALHRAYDSVLAKHSVEEEDLRAAKVNHADASSLKEVLAQIEEENKKLSQ